MGSSAQTAPLVRTIDSNRTELNLFNPGIDHKQHRTYPTLGNVLPEIFEGPSRSRAHTRALALKRIRNGATHAGSFEKNYENLESIKKQDNAIYLAAQQADLTTILRGMEYFFEFETALRLSLQKTTEFGTRRNLSDATRVCSDIHRKLETLAGRYDGSVAENSWFNPSAIFQDITDSDPIPFNRISVALISFAQQLEVGLDALPTDVDPVAQKRWRGLLQNIKKSAKRLPDTFIGDPGADTEESARMLVNTFAGLANKLAHIDLSVRACLQRQSAGYCDATFQRSGEDFVIGFQGHTLRVPEQGALIIDARAHKEPSDLIRGVGLAYILSQAGFPIPAIEARLSFAPRIGAVIPSGLETVSEVEGDGGAGFFVTSLKEVLEIADTLPRGSIICLDRIPRGSNPDALSTTETALFHRLLEKDLRVIIASNSPSELIKKGYEGNVFVLLNEDLNEVPSIALRLQGLELCQPPRPVIWEADRHVCISDQQMAGEIYTVLSRRFSETPSVKDELLQRSGLGVYLERGRFDGQVSQDSLTYDLNGGFSKSRTEVDHWEGMLARLTPVEIEQFAEALSKFGVAYDAASKSYATIQRERGPLSGLGEEYRGPLFDSMAEFKTSATQCIEMYRGFQVRYGDDVFEESPVRQIEEGLNAAQENLDNPTMRIEYLGYTLPDTLHSVGEFIQGARRRLALISLEANDSNLTSPKRLGSDNEYFLTAMNIQPAIFGRVVSETIQHHDKEKRIKLPTVKSHETTPVSIEIKRGDHCTIIHGPNSGGKTLLLKTLAIELGIGQGGLLTSGEIQVGDAEAVIPIFSRPTPSESADSVFRRTVELATDALAKSHHPRIVIMDELHGVDPSLIAAAQIELMTLAHQNGHYLILNTHTLEGIAEAQKMGKAVVWKMSGAPDYRLEKDENPIPSSNGWAIAQSIISEHDRRRAN